MEKKNGKFISVYKVRQQVVKRRKFLLIEADEKRNNVQLVVTALVNKKSSIKYRNRMEHLSHKPFMTIGRNAYTEESKKRIIKK